jgi:hypothetical protein
MALKLAAVKALLWRGVLWACRRWARAAPLAPAQLRPSLPHPLGFKSKMKCSDEEDDEPAFNSKPAPIQSSRSSAIASGSVPAPPAPAPRAAGTVRSPSEAVVTLMQRASNSVPASSSAGFDLDALVRRVAARSASAPAGGSPLLYGPSRRSSQPLQLSFGAKVRRGRLSLGASIRSEPLGCRCRRARRWRPWGRCCGRRPNSTRPAAAVCAAGHL